MNDDKEDKKPTEDTAAPATDQKPDADAYIGEEGWDNLASDLDLTFLDEDQE